MEEFVEDSVENFAEGSAEDSAEGSAGKSRIKQSFYSLSSDDALSSLGSSTNGLSETEAAQRLAAHGQNKLDEPKKHGIVYNFFMQFKNVMVLVLLAAAAVTAAVAIFEQAYREFIDVGVILAIVLINAVIGVIQEHRASSALEALKKMSQPYAKVRRGGEIMRVETTALVTGDIVLLEAGDVVPADLRLTASASLKIEESSLTGESVPSEKSAGAVCEPNAPLGDRHNMAFSSCVVSYGRGEGVVSATGMNTQMGKIAGMLTAADEGETPLQARLNKTGKLISLFVLLVAVAIFAVSMIGSAVSGGVGVSTVLHAFMTAVAIAVAAIPEGLTAVITIIMAIGIQKLSGRGAIVKKLTAVETLGSTEIICSDKTGTLTLNRMTVVETYQRGEKAREQLVHCMVLCNDTVIKGGAAKAENATFSANSADFKQLNFEQGSNAGNLDLIGDPTETALTSYAHRCGIDVSALVFHQKRLGEQPFDSERKMMSTFNRTGDTVTVFTKGAPDLLLARCSFIMDEGRVRPINQDDRDEISKTNREFGSQALRVLAFAQKVLTDSDAFDSAGSDSANSNSDSPAALEQDQERDLVFLGLAGMIDPPRTEVAAAVETCKKAGITPVMITGDHQVTAFAIAREIGIAFSEKQVTTGAAIALLTDEQLRDCVTDFRVYARVSPEHKVRIVKAWQSLGKIVAMTGDGVNDAPSLKAADIGVGMGITGTDVTKGAADMVLSDDNFATIVVAVREGRKIFANIQKTVQFLLSANIAEVFSLLVATIAFAFLGGEMVFLLPIQILWINLVTDSLPAIALGLEAEDKGTMTRPPERSGGSLFSGHIGANIIWQGLLQSALVLAVYFACVGSAWGAEVGTTMAFVVLSLIQLFHCFNVKSVDRSILGRNLFRNRVMLLSFGVGAVLTVGVALIPPLRDVFGLVGLSGLQWLTAVLTAFAILPLVELGKLVFAKFYRRKSK